VNHRGDADSTGAICAQIAGAFYGESTIDRRWVENLEQWDRGEIALRAIALFVAGPGSDPTTKPATSDVDSLT
jgi:ADP-ribosyl-[dinitrogen reductase] hydrolase